MLPVLKIALKRQRPGFLARQHSLVQQVCRFVSSAPTKRNPFITTPIYYVNAVPHIGHVYSTVYSDVLYRWQKQESRHLEQPPAAIFSTGTDEHGLKIQQAAEAAKLPPLDHCNKVSSVYKKLFDQCEISYTDFIRTTSPDHRKTVEHFWNVLVEKGHIYKGSFSGWYSVSDEAFIPEMQTETVTDSDGNKTQVVMESGSPVTWLEEENYLFRLTAFIPQLIDWLEDDPSVIQPPSVLGSLISILDSDTIGDLSVSRSSSRLPWGIPVPGDSSQTIYVWLDALVNYLTVAGYPNKPDFKKNWPPTMQVIGSDILKFHAVYWPAFLLAAGLELPQRIIAHNHFTVDSKKMSKSRGNTQSAEGLLEDYGVAASRFFLISASLLDDNREFSAERVKNAFNDNLADIYGNLLLRIMSKKCMPDAVYPEICREHLPAFRGCSADLKGNEWVFPDTPGAEGDIQVISSELLSSLVTYADTVEMLFPLGRLGQVLHITFELLRNANALFANFQPWQLAKGVGDYAPQKLAFCNRLVLESLVAGGIVLNCIVPTPMGDVLSSLGVEEESRNLGRIRMFQDVIESGAHDTAAGNSIVRFKRIPFQKFDQKHQTS